MRWSPDDGTILFDSLRYESVDSGPSDVYTIPSTGGDDGESRFVRCPQTSALYLRDDGSRVYYLSGDVKDSAELPALRSANPDGSDRACRRRKGHGFVGRFAAGRHEGGRRTVRLRRLPAGNSRCSTSTVPAIRICARSISRTAALANVTPPKGEAWSCTVSHDGSRVAYLYSDFMHPADVYVRLTSGGPAADHERQRRRTLHR